MIVTDINQERINRASSIYTKERAMKQGIDLHYINTSTEDIELKSLTPDHTGFNDVFVFAPSPELIKHADDILAFDGCLNFFAGPTNPTFSASLNFYNIHYAATHIVATSGGNTSDLKESLDLMSRGLVDPSALITHIGGLNAVIDTTLNLPSIPGGKKLIYNHIDFPLMSIEDILKKDGEIFLGLSKIIKEHNGLWSPKAEQFLLANAPNI